MLIYCLQTQIVYFMKLKQMMVQEDFYENKNLFDYSDCPQDSIFLDRANKNLIGKMKDEVKGKVISEFVGLKSKIYF